MNSPTHRLLVVIEGSERDAAVLTAATRLLRPDSAIVLLRVVAPSPESDRIGDLLPGIDRSERAAQDELRRQACAFAGHAAETVVLVGPDADAEIAAWIDGHPVDAVVIPARERRGFGLLWPGRRAPRLARLGHTPVITVYPAPAAPAPVRQTLPAA